MAYMDSEDRRAETTFAMCAALLQPSLLTVYDDSDPRCPATLSSLCLLASATAKHQGTEMGPC